MNILAINTSFSKSYVGVQANTKTVLKEMDSSLKQSENILGLIDASLNEAQINLNSINAIACVIGPGSFTGIRIGCSLAKGFCSAISSIKRIAINSLNLIAYSFAKTNPTSDFWVVLNALSGNLFVAKYNHLGQQIIKSSLCFGEELQKISGTVVGLIDEQLEMCNNYVSLSANDLLEYAQNLYKKDEYSVDFTPIYLRKSQAESELDKKDANN